MTVPTFTPALLDLYTELIATVLYLGRNSATSPNIDQLSPILEQLLDRSQSQAAKNGVTKDRWLAGLYPVVAWIDEQLLNMDWPGRSSWAGQSLQRRLFQTTLAGRDFFVRLEQLSPEDHSLREVYDLCLALGFRGQFFQPEDTDRLREIMDSNLNTMHVALPLRLPAPLFPNKNEHAVFNGVQGYRPDKPLVQALLWLLPVLLLLGLYLLLRGSLSSAG
jgi:type VI secretion system protein ImpK